MNDTIEAQREAFKIGARTRWNKGWRYSEEELNKEAAKLFPTQPVVVQPAVKDLTLSDLIRLTKKVPRNVALKNSRNEAFRGVFMDLSDEVNTLFLSTNSESPDPNIWTTARGEQIQVSAMDDQHLYNTIRFIERDHYRSVMWASKYSEMVKEAVKRFGLPWRK